MYCRLVFIFSIFLYNYCFYFPTLWAIRDTQVQGNDTLTVCTPQNPNLQEAQAAPAASSNPLPSAESALSVLSLPDDMLGLIFEFYSMDADGGVDTLDMVRWSKVCKRFKYIYDQHIFSLLDTLHLRSLASLDSFIAPNSSGTRPIDCFSGNIILAPQIVRSLLQQQKATAQAMSDPEDMESTVTEPSATITPKTALMLADVEQAMQAHYDRGNSLSLSVQNEENKTKYEEIAPFACLPVTDLKIGEKGLVYFEPLNLFTHLTTLSVTTEHSESTLLFEQLKNVKSLTLHKCDWETLNGFGHCESLDFLNVYNHKFLTNLGDIGQSKTLRKVVLSHLPRLESLEALGLLENLQEVYIQKLGNLHSVEPLLQCPQLTKLTLYNLELPEIPFLTKPTNLRCLEVTGWKFDNTLQITASNLQQINIRRCDIRKIILAECFKDRSNPADRTLRIDDCRHLTQIDGLNNCQDFTFLSLQNNCVLEVFGPCAPFAHLDLTACPQLMPTASWLQVQHLINSRVLPLFDPVPEQQRLVHLELKEDAARDPDLLLKLQQLTALKRLVLDRKPQNMAAIRAFCKEKNITMLLDDINGYGPEPFSLNDEVPNEG